MVAFALCAMFACACASSSGAKKDDAKPAATQDTGEVPYKPQGAAAQQQQPAQQSGAQPAAGGPAPEQQPAATAAPAEPPKPAFSERTQGVFK